jgi:hypothetical protein
VRYKNKHTVIVGLLIVAGLALPAWSQDRPEDKLLQEAKLLIFDGKWQPALDKLDTILRQYPGGPVTTQTLFYRAECLSKLTGREKDALQAYRDYLKTGDRNESLVEQAEVSLIELSSSLYEQGDKDAIREVVGRLSSANKAVRYYAAYKLSACKDKAVAAQSIPVLQGILKSETNPELTDRARIALLRVDPKSLERIDRTPERQKARVLRIQIIGGGLEKVNISIPLALADLALQALSDESKSALRQKGYDLDRILGDLERTGGSVLEIRDEKEGAVIKIWIDIK